jgi:tocopherol O-methyltransferase
MTLPPTAPADDSPDRAPLVEDIATHYDELDDAYRQIWSDHAHHGLWLTGRESIDEAVQAVVDVTADAARVGPGSQVIDLGSGYGATGRRLAATRDAEVTSLTISKRQHDYAVAADAGNPLLHQHLRDWFANELPAEGYDAVIAIESLGHLETAPALAEVFRVLRPGGRVAVCDLVAGDRVPRLLEGPLLRTMERESHLVRLSTIAQWRDQFTAAGFVVDQSRDLTRGVRSTWPKGIRRLIGTLYRNPEFRRTLFGGEYQNDGFVRSLIRMTIAQRLGVVRYYLVSAYKPEM